MKVIIKMFSSLFSLEMIFSLFLLSAVFKESIDMPVDLSLFFFAIMLVICLIKFLKKPVIPLVSLFPLAIFLVLTCLLMVSYMFTPSLVYAQDKLIKFFLFTFTAFVFPLMFFEKEKSIPKFINSVFIVTLVMAIYTLIKIVNNAGGTEFIAFNDGNYLGLGRALGLCAVIALSKFLFAKRKLSSLMYLIIIPLVLYALLSVGARMPLLAVVMVLVLMIPYTTFRIKNFKIFVSGSFKKMTLLILIAIGAVYSLVASGFSSKTLDRVSYLFTQQGGGDSASGRTARYLTAWDVTGNHPFFGNGIGSFGIFYDGADVRDYPHNIFLEMLSEVGIVGFITIAILLIGGLILGWKTISKKKAVHNYEFTLFFLYVFYFINTNVTGDINDNRFLFALLGCLFINRDTPQNLIEFCRRFTSKLNNRNIEKRLLQ